jgi:hypothetical protein
VAGADAPGNHAKLERHAGRSAAGVALVAAAIVAAPARKYERHRPETTALYEVVRDNLETLYGAIDEGALGVKLARHAKKELGGYLDCGLLCRGLRGSSATSAPRAGWWPSVRHIARAHRAITRS